MSIEIKSNQIMLFGFCEFLALSVNRVSYNMSAKLQLLQCSINPCSKQCSIQKCDTNVLDVIGNKNLSFNQWQWITKLVCKMGPLKTMTALYNLLEMGRGVGQLQNVLFFLSWKTEHLSPNEEERELAVHCVRNPHS